MLSVDSVSMGILELGNNVYEQASLDAFAAKYRPNDVPAGWAPIMNSIDGGSLNGGSSPETIEADVDFEWALNVVYPQNITLYQVGTANQSGSFGNFLDAVDASYCGGDDPRWDPQYAGGNTCGAFAATQVVSSSYAGNEVSYSTNVDANGNPYLTDYYPQRQCMEYMKLGLMGTTVLFSSGDNGAAGASGWCPAFGPADDYNNNYYYQQDTDGYYAPQ
jgi:tripeptidyl-peptidase-1